MTFSVCCQVLRHLKLLFQCAIYFVLEEEITSFKLKKYNSVTFYNLCFSDGTSWTCNKNEAISFHVEGEFFLILLTWVYISVEKRGKKKIRLHEAYRGGGCFVMYCIHTLSLKRLVGYTYVFKILSTDINSKIAAIFTESLKAYPMVFLSTWYIPSC